MESLKALLDARGTKIGSHRIRRQLARFDPIIVWSTPLHASVSITLTPQSPSECNLGMTINFNSLHREVFLFIPLNEALILPSNGKLEAEYLDAVQGLMNTPEDRH
jgi:hypothetical protein